MSGNKYLLSELLALRYPGLKRKEIFARILCGEVFINGEKIREPRAPVEKESIIVFKSGKAFVSRGGEKLDSILSTWQVEIKDLVFIDAGASTGGFTDCLLKRGVRKVYTIDVGYNQLDFILRQDKRVEVFERTNVMSVNREMFSTVPDAAVADISFRSVRIVASHLLSIVSKGWLIALIKPQFEWAEPDRNFRGIVDETKHFAILSHLIEDLWGEGAYVSKLAVSSIRGRKGNIEFFFFITKEELITKADILDKVKEIVISCGK